MRCAVSSRVWISALYVHAQRIVGVNVVIGVLVVHCELHVVVRVHVPLVVCDEAVVRRTLSLIALVVIVVFVVAMFNRILLYGRYNLYTSMKRPQYFECNAADEAEERATFCNEHTRTRTTESGRDGWRDFRGLCDGVKGSGTRHDHRSNHSFCRRSVRKDEETDEENDGCCATGTETVREVGLDKVVEDCPEIEQGDWSTLQR